MAIITISFILIHPHLSIGLSLLLIILVISSCVVVMYIKRSRRDSYNVTVEEVFKRDNIADYHIDGGVEEDVDERFGDYMHMHAYDGDPEHFSAANGGKTRLLDHCGSDRGYGGSSDASPTFILLQPIRNTRKASPSPSGKSSEDDYFDCADFHYGRAVAVDLSNKAPKEKRATDSTVRDQERHRSDPDKFHITTNPLLNSKIVDRDNCHGHPLEPRPRNSSSSKSDEKSELSSSDEGFASPLTHSSPSSQDDGPIHKPRHVNTEVPLKNRTKSPKKVSTKNPKEAAKTTVRAPVLSNCIIRDDVPFPPDKNIDAGSDPDEVSSPPEKVLSPGEMTEEPVHRCPSPSVRLYEPPNDTSDSKRNKDEIPGKTFQNGIPDIPDDFPPPYNHRHYDDFPPPPKEAYAYTSEPEDGKRPKNAISMPHPSNFLPRDTLERFSYEGGGSPSGSLSSLGSDSGDDVTWVSVNEFGDRFRKLAGIYGMPPSVSFSPHDEIIE